MTAVRWTVRTAGMFILYAAVSVAAGVGIGSVLHWWQHR